MKVSDEMRRGGTSLGLIFLGLVGFLFSMLPSLLGNGLCFFFAVFGSGQHNYPATSEVFLVLSVVVFMLVFTATLLGKSFNNSLPNHSLFCSSLICLSNLFSVFWFYGVSNFHL